MRNASLEEQGSGLSWRERAFGVALALLVMLGCALASGSASAAEAGDSLTISLLTMGPGEHPFTKFGHSALWVHDTATGHDEIYNYGTFAFDSPTLFLDSAQGKLPYWLSVQSLGSTLRSYGEAQRSLLVSELDLTPSERDALYTALRENERPENRYYRYDFYRDNCSTRVRDAIDRVIGGQIRAQAQKPARMSFRAHTERLVADDALLYAALDVAIGRGTDSPIAFWDEGFLPSRLRDLVVNTSVVREGQKLALVKSERLLLPSSLPEPRPWPPDWIGRYFGGLILATRSRRALRRRSAWRARHCLHAAGLAARVARLRAVLPDLHLVALRSRAELQRAAGAAMAAAARRRRPQYGAWKGLGLGRRALGHQRHPAVLRRRVVRARGAAEPAAELAGACVCLAALAGRWRSGVPRLRINADPPRL
jgi:hypothetical protein